MDKVRCVLDGISNEIDLSNLEISKKIICTDQDFKYTIGELKCEEPNGSFLIPKNKG